MNIIDRKCRAGKHRCWSQFSILLISFLLACCLGVFLPFLPNLVFLFFLLLVCAAYAVKDIRLLPVVAFIVGLYFFSSSMAGLIQLKPSKEMMGQKFEMDSIITNFPQTNMEQQRFVVKVEALSLADSFNDEVNRENKISQPSNLPNWRGRNVIVSCFKCDHQFKLGERWLLPIRVKIIHGSASWGGFDYERWVLSNSLVAKAVVLSGSEPIRLSRPDWIDQKRIDIRDVIETAPIHQYTKAVLAALSIGDRSFFDAKVWHFFKSTGLGHLVAISGLHVSFVYLITCGLIRLFLNQISHIYPSIYNRVPAQVLSAILALKVTFLYCSLAGFSIPTQRAFIMLTLFCLIRFCVRELSREKALLYAFTIIIIFDPGALLSLSLWMSVIAVLIILLILNAKPRLPVLSIQLNLSIGMAMTSMLMIGSSSLISPLANIIVVPLIGFIALPLVLIFLCLVLITQIELAQLILMLLDKLGSWFYIKGFSSWIDSGDLLFEASLNSVAAQLGLCLLAIVWVLKTRFLLFKSVVLIALICLFLPITTRLKTGEFLVTTLDVGQALAMVIETKNSTTIYDTGNRYPTSDSAVTTILPYLRYRSIKRINHMIISHHDTDHIGGMDSLLAALPIENVWSHQRIYSFQPSLNPNSRFMQAMYRFNQCHQGKSWAIDGVSYEILSPQARSAIRHDAYSENNLSCVLRIKSKYGVVLITGDIERSVEHDLVRGLGLSAGLGLIEKPETEPILKLSKLSADVLLLGHHGSKTSSSPAFLDEVKPSLAITSAGFMSRHGHPHKVVIDRLDRREVRHLNTANSGSIQTAFTEEGILTKEYRSSYPRFWR